MKLLQTSGDLPFDLPMGWLDGYASTSFAHNKAGLEEVSSSDDGEACSDNAEASSHDGGEGKAVDDEKGWVVGGTNAPLGPPRVGSFVFFKSRHAPFLVGRVVKVESDEEGDEVAVVHWFSPSNQKIRNSANVISVLAYANGRFSEDFLPSTGQNRSKRTLTPDVGKELTSRVIASCDKLTGSNKIPAPVKSKLFSFCANVRGAVSSPSLSFKGSESDDTESDDNEVADGEEVGGDAVDEEESDAETAELIGRYDSNQDGEMCKEGVGSTQDSSSCRSYSSPSRSKFPMTAAAYRPRRGPTSCRGAKPGE